MQLLYPQNTVWMIRKYCLEVTLWKTDWVTANSHLLKLIDKNLQVLTCNPRRPGTKMFAEDFIATRNFIAAVSQQGEAACRVPFIEIKKGKLVHRAATTCYRCFLPDLAGFTGS